MSEREIKSAILTNRAMVWFVAALLFRYMERSKFAFGSAVAMSVLTFVQAALVSIDWEGLK